MIGESLGEQTGNSVEANGTPGWCVASMISDVLEPLQNNLKAVGEQTVVVFMHIDTNGIGRKRGEILQKKYIELAEG